MLAAPLTGSLQAASLVTTNCQSGSANWTAAIWKTNLATADFFSPVAGNTYTCVSNGIAFGNNANNTRIRNIVGAGQPVFQTFPGDSLTLNTNTEIRFKLVTAGSPPVCDFPGVGGNPGLILNGGVLNAGEDATFVITGRIQVAAQSYISPGNNGGGAALPLRAFDIAGQLSGSGTLVFMQGTNTVPQRISGNSNTFKGRWIVKAGWLQATGTNSLGTNSITLDPNYVLPLQGSIIDVAGPAVFEPGYDVNSAGRLTLTNGAVMVLHQNCAFTSARIEGASLSQGTHYYSELVTSFPTSFAAGGSGSITIQPYGQPPQFAPTISTQPSSAMLYTGFATQLVATASGAAPLSWFWQKGTNGIYVTLNDGGDVSGSRSNILSFSSAVLADAADYRAVVTNTLGAATSSVASLTVIVPTRPWVVSLDPPAGSTVSGLTKLDVVFSTNVLGVDPFDLQINGTPAASVSGAGTSYRFTFNQPSPGPVVVGWDPDSALTDSLGISFDTSVTWNYTLADIIPPALASTVPAAGSTVGSLQQAQVAFTEPVTNVRASDLLLNGVPAITVAGSGAGPYTFAFQAAGAPNSTFSLGPGSIADLAGNRFAGADWSVSVDPSAAAAALTNIVLNEFLTSNVNTNGFRDEDLELSDWIEVYNRGASEVNLAGWGLTDDPAQATRWTFPAVTIFPGEYRIVFASGKNRRNPASNLHTSFSLSSAGEYLGLWNGEYPPRAAHEYAPAYPEQRNDISYGMDASGQARYFAVQTPGGPNSSITLTGLVDNVHFSVERGFFNQPFTLKLVVNTPGAEIRYTTDGSIPNEASSLYTGPLDITGTTILRAAGFAPDQLPSEIKTHTYIFPEQVLNQSANPPGFPITTTWSTYGWPSDYAMDPNVVYDPIYSGDIGRAMLALPSLSIVMNTDDMFGDANGLYTHTADVSKEAACSVELLNPDGSAGFQVDAGIKMHGGGSRARTMKHPFRLMFQGQYGATKLRYRLFPDSPVEEFDLLDLRSDYNNHWTHGFDNAQRSRGGLVRDAFFKDLQASMGAMSSHSRYVHLYINGLYWGVYNPCERPDASFAASYLGGDKTQCDAFSGSENSTTNQLVDGGWVAHTAMVALNNTNLASLAQYEQLRQYLDVPQYIDYMIGQLYGANWDWGTYKNWYAVRLREPGAGFKYLAWDSERTLEGVNDKVTVSPDNLQANLVRNAEYRLEFADHVHKHFFNGGAMTTNRVMSTWQARASQLDLAIIGESARWGDSVPNGKTAITPLPYPSYTVGTSYTRLENWLGEQGRLFTNYFPFRSGVVLTQFMQAGLYPSVTAPAFNQHGGPVAPGFNLTMTAPAGTIYYTLDGSDPRLYGVGSLGPQALPYASPVSVLSNCVVKARVLGSGTWSALNEATFTVSGMGIPVRFTELMYHPIGGDAYEFIELQNVGGMPVDLGGFSFEGISLVIPEGTVLIPGAVVVFASNTDPAAFATRYPGVLVAGWFGGSLSNSGERIALLDRSGNTVTSVEYKDSGGWPVAADGDGYSLEILDANGDPDDPANWRASSAVNGTPGAPRLAGASPLVRLNEVMAENVGAVTNGATSPDWVELYNPGSAALSLANWSFSNSGNARRYVFPGAASIPGQGYLVLWCDSDTNAPGLHAGFNLGRNGESLFLFDASTNLVDAFTFGLQLTNYSVGRLGASSTWQLCLPTPRSNNVAAVVGAATSLVLNEWLANPFPGDPDWLELFNTSATLPVPLQGLYVATSNEVYQLRSVSFVAPRSFVQLYADRAVGPNHVDLKLSASGDALGLFDSFGQPLNTVAFGAQTEGVSEGRWPNGSASITDFPGTASPGVSNYVAAYTGPVLNELMARNVSAVYDSRGNNPDWLELYNPNATAYSLAGMSLSTDPSHPGAWTFPAGSSILGYGWLRIWCDPSAPASTNSGANLNAGFALNAQGDTVCLFNTGRQLVDSVRFGLQVVDMSIGRDAGTWTLLSQPTPGAANAPAAALGNAAALRFNEWMALPLSGDDWFELYNSEAAPVALGGLFITDNPSVTGITNFQVAPLSFIAAHGWAGFEADGSPGKGANHVAFSLDAYTETLRLYGPDQSLIDAVDYGLQTPGVSEGRLPDGGFNIVSFPATPTPERSNYLPLENVFINEVLAHTDPPLEDAIELFNAGAGTVQLGGWYLSNSEQEPKKFRIWDGVSIGPRGYTVFYEYEFNGSATVPFTLNSAHGDQVLLSEADAFGNLTGYRVQVSFGASKNGVSMGRLRTSTGFDFVNLASRTFGVDNPPDVTRFRTGPGLTNSYAQVGPVGFSEIMYHPVSGTGTNLVENPDEEFVELFNGTSNPVPLYDPSAPTNCWKLAGAVDYVFPAATVLQPGAYALVVGFDPAANLAALTAFRAKYNLATTVPLFGPFQGRLNNAGESLELYQPDTPQAAPHPDAGYVPYVLVERVNYGPVSPWPVGADGTGASLQRVSANAYGNEPLNWTACVPSPGSGICSLDSDGDGLPDDWETAHGLDPHSALGNNGASGDPDGDGFTNWQEYLAGTDPQDRLSCLKIRFSGLVSGGIELRFDGVQGRSYTVQYSDALNTAAWQTLTHVSTMTSSTPVVVQDPSGASRTRFYRVVTPRLP